MGIGGRDRFRPVMSSGVTASLCELSGLMICLHELRGCQTTDKVAQENWQIKSLNHDTGPMWSFATLYNISYNRVTK